MKDIYPEAETVVEIEKLDELTVANAIIEQVEAGLTKAQAIGPVLNGSDDVATFNKVWAEIEASAKSLRKISVVKTVIVKEAEGTLGEEDYTPAQTEVKDKTEAEYLADLDGVKGYLDRPKWYAGIKEEKGVSNWTEYKNIMKGNIE
jgi:hypothetical protein